jgi:hypothetical protein
MNLKSFKQFNESESVRPYYPRYGRTYNEYQKGKTGFSRWMRGISDKIESGSDDLKTLRNSKDGNIKLGTQFLGDTIGLLARAIGSIADFATPSGDNYYEYRNKGRKRFDEEMERRRKELVEKWEKENMNKQVTEEDAENFYQSGILAGRKKFGTNFNPEKPKDDEQKLYSSYMSDVMHKYYNKIDNVKKSS